MLKQVNLVCSTSWLVSDHVPQYPSYRHWTATSTALLREKDQKLFHTSEAQTQKSSWKQYHDEGRVKFLEFKLNDVVLVRNWRRREVERCIQVRITQVTGLRTYLVRGVNQVQFVHIDHLKWTACKLTVPAAYQGAQLKGLPREEDQEIQAPLTSGFPVVSGRTVTESVKDSSISEEAGSTIETHLEKSIGPSSPGFAYQQRSYPLRVRKSPRELICQVWAEL